MTVADFVVRELHLMYWFMWRDIVCAIIAGFVYTYAAAATFSGLSPEEYASVPLWMVAYFILYLYTYDLCNQITGVEEDRLNKPDRPIPSGLVTIQGAKVRWYIVNVLYILAGLAIGNVWSSLLWFVTSTMYSYGEWEKHWFTKNFVAMTLGVIVQGWASWSIASGNIWMAPKYATFVAVMSLYVGTTTNFADLKDVEGDIEVGRKTLPILYGMKVSKVLVSLMFAVVFAIMYFAIWHLSVQTVNISVLQALYIFADLLGHLYIILRTLFVDQTSSDMYHTYYFYTMLYPFTILKVIIF